MLNMFILQIMTLQPFNMPQAQIAGVCAFPWLFLPARRPLWGLHARLLAYQTHLRPVSRCCRSALTSCCDVVQDAMSGLVTVTGG